MPCSRRIGRRFGSPSTRTRVRRPWTSMMSGALMHSRVALTRDGHLAPFAPTSAARRAFCTRSKSQQHSVESQQTGSDQSVDRLCLAPLPPQKLQCRRNCDEVVRQWAWQELVGGDHPSDDCIPVTMQSFGRPDAATPECDKGQYGVDRLGIGMCEIAKSIADEIVGQLGVGGHKGGQLYVFKPGYLV